MRRLDGVKYFAQLLCFMFTFGTDRKMGMNQPTSVIVKFARQIIR